MITIWKATKIIEGFKIVVQEERCFLHCANYDNGRLAIQVICESGEPFGMLTVNFPDTFVGPREICIKNWSENEELAKLAFDTGLFEDTGRRAGVLAPIWRLLKNVGVR